MIDLINKKIENERGKYLMNLEVIVVYEWILIGFFFMNIWLILIFIDIIVLFEKYFLIYGF